MNNNNDEMNLEANDECENANNYEEILKEKEDEVNELNNRLLRLQADFINFRKRSEKEKETSFSNGIQCFVGDLLPILDNFQRALDFQNDKEDSFYKGVEMIENQILDLLRSNGVEEIASLGNEFDPNYHHAVTMEESDTYESGIVIDVLQKGYILKDKVIRPSMVKVSK